MRQSPNPYDIEWLERVTAGLPAPRPLTELPEHRMDQLARLLAQHAHRRIARERQAQQQTTPPADRHTNVA